VVYKVPHALQTVSDGCIHDTVHKGITHAACTREPVDTQSPSMQHKDDCFMHCKLLQPRGAVKQAATKHNTNSCTPHVRDQQATAQQVALHNSCRASHTARFHYCMTQSMPNSTTASLLPLLRQHPLLLRQSHHHHSCVIAS
jgi:hypothetical protein